MYTVQLVPYSLLVRYPYFARHTVRITEYLATSQSVSRRLPSYIKASEIKKPILKNCNQEHSKYQSRGCMYDILWWLLK